MLWKIPALFLALLIVNTGPAAAAGAPAADWSYVEKRLRQEKFSSTFIKDMKRIYKPKDFMKVLELNILLFLRNTDYHTPQVSGDAVAEVRAFVSKNRKSFNVIEKKYGVPAEAISSLLYIETRHGKNTGSFHVASVYLHLLQADRPSVVRYLKSRLPAYTSKYDKPMQAKIAKRAKSKAAWALAETRALSQIDKRDRKILKNLKGSYSGAFGMAQFIPSSYVKLAKPFRKGRSPDLGKADDAITSVAHYLHQSGWRKSQKRSHKRALMKYNNSEDYAEAILGLARRSAPAKAGKPVNVAKREVQTAVRTRPKPAAVKGAPSNDPDDVSVKLYRPKPKR